MYKGRKNDQTKACFRLRRAVPNTVTSFSLLCGCAATVLALRGWIDYAVYALFAAAVLDFCDGLSARLLRVSSELGKQLDSLADLVGFGLAPAALLHYKLRLILNETISGGLSAFGWELLTLAPFVVTVFSALRLAKFNIDTRQHDRFIGLPTPANALLIAALTSLSMDGNQLTAWMESWYAILILCGVLSALLVCGLPMFALKFKNLRWRDNRQQFVFFILVAVIAAASVLWQQGLMFAVAAVIVSYILLSALLYAIWAQPAHNQSKIISSN
ncbi:MAG: CDP-alcohol phosphatidyltransferase family protein [Prevotellaceae bacterium]|jgi:CDP-diacylglycerol--serine O-phosphatidyltransferase|nr:CDP-alcohol phosphatidyltransferase family protein [Prevotellaceae bacterium]